MPRYASCQSTPRCAPFYTYRHHTHYAHAFHTRGARQVDLAEKYQFWTNTLSNGVWMVTDDLRRGGQKTNSTCANIAPPCLSGCNTTNPRGIPACATRMACVPCALASSHVPLLFTGGRMASLRLPHTPPHTTRCHYRHCTFHSRCFPHTRTAHTHTCLPLRASSLSLAHHACAAAHVQPTATSLVFGWAGRTHLPMWKVAHCRAKRTTHHAYTAKHTKEACLYSHGGEQGDGSRTRRTRGGANSRG